VRDPPTPRSRRRAAVASPSPRIRGASTRTPCFARWWTSSGGASWDLAAHAIAHRDAADCKDRFRRVAASRAKSISDSASKPASPLRVTPEVTKALFRQTAEETFPGCEGAPEPATALRAEVRAARGALATAGGVGAAKAAVAGGGGALLRRRPRVWAAMKNASFIRARVRAL
jgi:hypothetical protein